MPPPISSSKSSTGSGRYSSPFSKLNNLRLPVILYCFSINSLSVIRFLGGVLGVSIVVSTIVEFESLNRARPICISALSPTFVQPQRLGLGLAQ